MIRFILGEALRAIFILGGTCLVLLVIGITPRNLGAPMMGAAIGYIGTTVSRILDRRREHQRILDFMKQGIKG